MEQLPPFLTNRETRSQILSQTEIHSIEEFVEVLAVPSNEGRIIEKLSNILDSAVKNNSIVTVIRTETGPSVIVSRKGVEIEDAVHHFLLIDGIHKRIVPKGGENWCETMSSFNVILGLADRKVRSDDGGIIYGTGIHFINSLDLAQKDQTITFDVLARKFIFKSDVHQYANTLVVIDAIGSTELLDEITQRTWYPAEVEVPKRPDYDAYTVHVMREHYTFVD